MEVAVCFMSRQDLPNGGLSNLDLARQFFKDKPNGLSLVIRRGRRTTLFTALSGAVTKVMVAILV